MDYMCCPRTRGLKILYGTFDFHSLYLLDAVPSKLSNYIPMTSERRTLLGYLKTGCQARAAAVRT